VTDPVFLTVADVLELHRDQLEFFGGSAGVRDEAALTSAVATPMATFGGEFLHIDMFEMAAAYAFHIAENQPFVDGNKRTALNAALVFLDLNGYAVADPDELLYDAMIAIGTRRMTKTELGDLLRRLASPLDDEEQ
jgi:death on curing protein